MDASAERYRRAKAIAQRVLEHPAEGREALLAEACDGDEPLRAEARWLIDAAEDASADRLPPIGSVATAGASATGDGIEAVLPRSYRVLARLGQGGMGVVHLAERTDGDLRQRVALKLLHAGGGSDAATLARFARERRILAQLDHPNIARLIDAGVNADGRPFLAMELVEGERIDRWCAGRGTGMRARIDLFLEVCAAVEHAHRQLVIHRDIKPANILVTDRGEPKLLDFGIARLLAHDDADPRTETALRALTYAYASPEQVSGEPLGTASDIYSLGVVLYELVTGVRPFDHLGSPHLASGAIVADDEITPPSRIAGVAGKAPESAGARAAAAAAAAAVRVPRDLDAIILKALRRDPAQRYASVAALADDLRRFLASEPVHARRGHWPYRARRFAWRRRWPLAASIAFAALLGAFALDREAQHARVARERDRAQAMLAYMTDLFGNADSLRSRGNQVTVREMLDRGVRELERRHDLSPAQRGSMLLSMGRAYNALGLGNEALPLLLAARDQVDAGAAGPEERAALLAELAAAYSTSRQTGASIAADAEAIRLLQSTDGDHRDEITRLRLRELHNHVNLLDIPLADSRAQLESILAQLQQRTPAPEPLLLQAYRALSSLYDAQDERERAVAMAEQALTLSNRRYGADDPRALSSRSVHANAVAKLDPERSVALYRALAADHERVTGPGLTLVGVLNNLGVTLSQLGRADEAIAVYERAARLAREHGGERHWLYLGASSNLATLKARHGHPREAQRLVLDVLPALEQAAAAGSMDGGYYAAALGTLGETQLALGDAPAAERSYRKGIAVLERIDREAYGEVRAELAQGLAKSTAAASTRAR
ncbi:MAG: serine/threonine protein kinase [Lysobacteraceae bacterium]|nr:MAG: serine/threonine protein kinase [Xanthomonadaceae bacterium]